jgi:hypothetical protein
MHPDVHTRPGHREGKDEESREAAAEEVAEDDDAGEARRGMARGERPGDGAADEGLETVELLERPRAVAGELDRERQEVGAPDACRGERGGRQDRLPGEHGEDRCEQDPDKPRVPDEGEPDEDWVEPAGAVLGDPEDYLPV